MKRCSASLLTGKIQVKTTSRLRGCHCRLDSLTACSAPSAAMSHKPDMAEIEKFCKLTLNKAECKRKIHCLQKKWLKRRSKQASRDEVCVTSMHCIFYKHCLILFLLAVQLCNMQRDWIKFKWLCYPFSHQRMENYWQHRPRLPLPPICVASREGKELACWWRRKLDGMRVKSGVKSKLVQADLWAVKCSLIRVPFFLLFRSF